jgi:hypothetical protein
MDVFALGSTVRSLPIGKILLAAPDKMKIGDQSKVDASVISGEMRNFPSMTFLPFWSYSLGLNEDFSVVTLA